MSRMSEEYLYYVYKLSTERTLSGSMVFWAIVY